MYAQERIDDNPDNFVMRTNVRAILAIEEAKIKTKNQQYRVKMYAYDI